MSDKDCLRCAHCCIDLGHPAYSEVTPGEPAQWRCDKGHWLLSDRGGKAEVREAFGKAKDCTDYMEEKPCSGP